MNNRLNQSMLRLPEPAFFSVPISGNGSKNPGSFKTENKFNNSLANSSSVYGGIVSPMRLPESKYSVSKQG